MEFREESIEVFNSYRDTTFNSSMSFQEAIENLESANNDYFYVSMRKEDVLEAMKNEPEVVEALDLDYIYLKELGIFIALKL